MTRKKIVVFFTGSGSTGKTTLFTEVSNLLSRSNVSYSTCTEVVRDLYKSGVIKDADVTAKDKSQILISAEMFLRFEEEFLKDVPIIISDRSPIDTLAYSRNKEDSLEYCNKYNERYLKVIFNTSDIIFLTFYFPPIIPFEKDYIRVEEGQRIIDKEIINILSEFKIPYKSLDMVDLKERIKFVTNLIFYNLLS